MAELAHDAHDASNCIVCRARAEAPARFLQVLALFAAGLLVTTGILDLRPKAAHRAAANAVPAPVVQVSKPATTADVPRHVAAVSTEARDAAATTLERGAAISFGRGFFTNGSVFATAAQVAQWRPLVVRAARAEGVDPNLLEAVVFVESSGRADVSAGSAVGLTQLHPAVARRFGLHVDVRHGNLLTRRIAHARRAQTASQLRHWRARYDERYAPAKELRATAAYLASAHETLGREDLAIEAYHLGIPALRNADQPYASLYFRGGRVDDYAFKVLAAKRLMGMYRVHPSALRYEADQQARKNSAEEYLHPLASTRRFGSPGEILRAEQRHVLRMIPVDTPTTHIAIAGSLGAEAHKLGRARRLYRALRPQTLAVLLYIGQRVHEISGARKPLILTSAVRDDRYQRVLQHVNVNAARSYSLHTTGYAFDIARAYASGRQGRAFQRVLDQLEAANAIAYIREASAIHIAVAADAMAKLKLLEVVD
jgi:soluble lytic murein transglycosylase-like protein